MTHAVTPPRPVPASGPGALPGFEARCSCGLVMRCSLEGILFRDIIEHAAWHQRTAKQ